MLYLRRPGEVANSGSVSLYVTRYSPVGEGTVALVGAHGEPGVAPIFCAEKPELADFIAENVISWQGSPFERDAPVVNATFTRGGDVRTAPHWRIDTGEDVVEAQWSRINAAVIMDRPLQSGDVVITHSLLFFADAAAITVNGNRVEGEPFVRENWRRAIGRPGSSCCFALSETMVTPG